MCEENRASIMLEELTCKEEQLTDTYFGFTLNLTWIMRYFVSSK